MIFDGFLHSIEQIEQETCNLINTTFKEKLNSSEGAFELLRKFNNITTPKEVDKLLKLKQEDVLHRYD